MMMTNLIIYAHLVAMHHDMKAAILHTTNLTAGQNDFNTCNSCVMMFLIELFYLFLWTLTNTK